MVLWPLDTTDDVALLIHGAKRLASTYDHARGTLSITPVDPSDAGKSKDELDHTRLVRPLSPLCSYLIPHALTVVYYLCERDHVNVLVPAPTICSDTMMLFQLDPRSGQHDIATFGR